MNYAHFETCTIWYRRKSHMNVWMRKHLSQRDYQIEIKWTFHNHFISDSNLITVIFQLIPPVDPSDLCCGARKRIRWCQIIKNMVNAEGNQNKIIIIWNTRTPVCLVLGIMMIGWMNVNLSEVQSSVKKHFQHGNSDRYGNLMILSLFLCSSLLLLLICRIQWATDVFILTSPKLLEIEWRLNLSRLESLQKWCLNYDHIQRRRHQHEEHWEIPWMRKNLIIFMFGMVNENRTSSHRFAHRRTRIRF